jgi:hypothetical protein
MTFEFFFTGGRPIVVANLDDDESVVALWNSATIDVKRAAAIFSLARS